MFWYAIVAYGFFVVFMVFVMIVRPRATGASRTGSESNELMGL